jgi:hypothetical protein
MGMSTEETDYSLYAFGMQESRKVTTDNEQ